VFKNMLEQLNKHFDHYSINALFMPAFFICLPLVFTTVAWYPDSKTIFGGIMTVLISFGVMSFLSVIISNMGNSIQRNYFNRWGGAPIILLFMPDNDEIDQYTKKRYFKWLNSKIPDLNLSLDQDDKSDLQQKIRSATNFLREYTRDKKKYPAIYRDNVAYGFSRNLVAIKYVGLAMSIISLVVNVAVIFYPDYFQLISGQNSTYSVTFLGVAALTVSVLSIFLLLFVVNESFVKQRAYRYARSLLEICEMN
jgi:hypothetical protein